MKRAKSLLLLAVLLGLVVLVTTALIVTRDAADASRSPAGDKQAAQNGSNPADLSAAPAADAAAGSTASHGAASATDSSGGKAAAGSGTLASSTPSSLVPAAGSAAGGAQSAAAPSSLGSASRFQSAGLPDVADTLAGVDLTIPAERERVAALLKAQEDRRMHGVVEKARMLGVPVLIKKKEGGISEIFAFEGDEPIYRTTFNANAGISSGADVLRGSGYTNLTGQGLTGLGVTAGVWDGGLARPTHQEFAEGQVALRDPDSVYLDHATHVAATLAGIGFQPDAQGMAPKTKIDTYFWRNDHGEMTLAGASLPSGEPGKIPISNHSYGLIYSPFRAGSYDALARGSDAVGYGLPYYLQFWSAGNDQGYSTNGGFFTIGDYALAKNIVTVGAVDDAVNAGVRSTSNATMSDFSSWGPAKDGRIKPDIVANGVDLYSAVDFSDQSYDTYSGTSMASPSAAGTTALLVEFYRRENGNQLPVASLLKALLIHTADDLPPAGPDYQFGWGLINGPKAADLIREHKTTPRFLSGTVSTAARRWTHTFNRVGAGPVRATLVWADPPAEVPSLTSTDPVLVHNLDLKIVAPDGTTEHLPYVMPYASSLDLADLTSPAVTGINNVDNVEQVNIPAAGSGAGSGSYTLVVTANGAMRSAQNFSVVLTGAGAPVNARPIVNLQTPQSADWFLPGRTIPMSATATDLKADGSPGSISKVEFLTNGIPVFTNTAAPYAWSGWTNAASGTYTVEARATDSEGLVGYSSPAIVEVREPLPGEVHPAFIPPTPNDAVFALAEDDSQRIYIGGMFTLLNGTTQVQRVARLSKAGVVDTNDFTLDAGPNGRVRVMAYRKEDKALYLGGDFTQVGTVSRPALAKLNVGLSGQKDGSLATSFAPLITTSAASIKASVRALVVQTNGDILIGGFFDKVNGQDRRNIAKIKSDGTLDPNFKPAANGTVCALAVQADGKILLGGEFTEVNGSAWNRLARVDGVTGATDTTLVLGTGQQTGFNGPIYSVAVDGTGNIYAGGSFNSYRGHPYHFNLIKIGPTGALQGNFNFEPGLNGSVQDIQLPAGGVVLASGAFTSVANNLLAISATDAGRVALFNADGTLSTSFNVGGVGADGTVSRALRLGSGHYLMAGSFASFNGVSRPRLAMVAGPPPTNPVPLASLVSRLRADSFTGAALDVPFTGGGAGAFGYRVIGNLPRGVRFDAATGRLAGVPLETGYFQVRVVATGAAGKKSEGVLELFVAQSAVSYDQWKAAWFAPGEIHLSGPSQVNNASGLSNLEVYAFSGGDPRAPDPDILAPALNVQSDSFPQIEWRFPRFALANYGGVTNVIYRAEAAGNPAGPWDNSDMVAEPGGLKVRGQSAMPSQFFRMRLIKP